MPGRLRQIDTRGKGEPCSHEHLHWLHPEGYIAHAEWAERMLKTHDQKLCPGSCGRYEIWEPKKA